MNAIRLANGPAAATILPKRGGLVANLTLNANGRTQELLWLPHDFAAEESGWPGGGVPILFPFGGRVFHEGQPSRYLLGGAVRAMPIHGFAYGMPWTVAKTTQSTVTLTVEDTEATRLLYPFAFTLSATYELRPQALGITLTATNKGTGGAPMPVALGLHPYFVRPANGTLETPASLHIAVTNAGGAGPARPLDVPASGIPLTEALTANAILARHAEPVTRLVDQDKATAISLRWGGDNGYRYIVLWRKEAEGFQCVEPWTALPDAVSAGSAGDAVWLAPGETTTAAVSIGFETAGIPSPSRH